MKPVLVAKAPAAPAKAKASKAAPKVAKPKKAPKADPSAPHVPKAAPSVARRRELHKKQMLEALEQSIGIVTTAAKKVGIDRESHYLWLQSDLEYKRLVEAMDNLGLDFAETSLFKQIREGSAAATIFYLKCKGKKRGYIERSELVVDAQVSVKEVRKVLASVFAPPQPTK